MPSHSSKTKRPPSRMPRPRQLFGKYKIERRLAEGGFAVVYQAQDTIEGIRVALKIPFDHLMSDEVLDDFRKEARLARQLQHPNILPLKNAEFIDDHLVLAYPLAEESLAERLKRRMGVAAAYNYSRQLLAAVAHAHQRRIIHCDIKPENLLLFPDDLLMLNDFGIAKVALRTIRGSGSGTVGFVAPEQAMGRPSYRSDVFSAGLVMWRMFSGRLPEWPYDWPPEGHARLRGRVPPDFIDLLRKAIDVNPRRRFKDAIAMQKAFAELGKKFQRYLPKKN